MELNGTYIISLYSFGRNFNIRTVWNNRKAVIRDLSPERIFYSRSDRYSVSELVTIYRALKKPENSVIEGDALIVRDVSCQSRVNLQLTEEETRILSQIEDRSDRIRMIALYRLAGRELSEEALEAMNPVAAEADAVELSKGETLPLTRINPDGADLRTVLIKVPETAPGCHVGDTFLKSGDVTYGVFQGQHLVGVAPAHACTSSYFMRYELSGDSPRLVVKSANSEKVVYEYSDAIFYTTLGRDNFAFIRGGSVYCDSNPLLKSKLSREVMSIYEPIMLTLEQDRLIITYKNGKTTVINI